MPRFRPIAAASVRRSRTRGLDPLIVVSALLVIATVALAALTFAHPGTGSVGGPTNVAFSSAVRGCPATGSTIRVGSLGTGTGPILVRQGSAAPVRSGVVRPGQTTDIVGSAGPRTVTVDGAGAAGLSVGTFGTNPLSGSRCTEPSSDYWFTGLGASSTHDSVVEIDNPADTMARVELTTYASGVSVAPPVVDDRVLAPRSRAVIDLFKTNPEYGVYAVHAAVQQGRALVSVLDQSQTPGQPALSDWMIPQFAPLATVTLLGVVPGSGQTLSVVNPGGNQLTAVVRLITKTATFAPAKFNGVTVPGNGVATADLGAILGGAKDVVGIEIDAPTPVVASLATVAGNDLAYTGADPVLAGEGGAVLPDGAKTVVLGGASVAGPVTVIARDASGQIVFRRSVQVTTVGGVSVGLPANAVLLQIQTNRVSLRAAVVVTGNGAIVVPVGRVIRISSVPFIRPGVD